MIYKLTARCVECTNAIRFSRTLNTALCIFTVSSATKGGVGVVFPPKYEVNLTIPY